MRTRPRKLKKIFIQKRETIEVRKKAQSKLPIIFGLHVSEDNRAREGSMNNIMEKLTFIK
jgi:hypothetical protein